MRKSIILTACLLFCLATIFAQGKQAIQKTCRKINNGKDYKRITIYDPEEFLGYTTNSSASLSGYYKGDTLVKITEWIEMPDKVVQNEYFYEHEKLIFVHVSETNDHPVFTGRYYFDNEKLLDNTIENKNNSAPEEHSVPGILATGKGYAILLNQKRSNYTSLR